LTKIGTVSVEYARLHVKNIFSNIVLIMMNLTTYYFGNFRPHQPAAILAGIPLGSVSELSHAMSDRILKFRSTGGIFLAHQEGGENTLKIEGKAFGRNRFLFLTMLDFLFSYGQAKVVDLFTDFIKGSVSSIPMLTTSLLTQDAWKPIRESATDTGIEERHLTFPVVTRTKIYTNMYIETYEFIESIENGMNCVTYNIFLRKYQAHYPYKWAEQETELGDSVWYYSENKDDEIISKLRFVDLMMEAGFSTAMIMYRFFQFIIGNSSEENIAYLTGINLNQQNYGEDNTSLALSRIYPDLNYNLNQLSISQKEELMLVD